MNIARSATNLKPRYTVRGIRGRLFSGFAILTIILVLAISLILFKLSSTDNIAREAIKVDMATHNTTYDLILELTQAQSTLRAWILIHDEQHKAEFTETWKNINHLKLTLETLSKQWNNTESLQSWQEITTLLGQLEAAQLKLINNESIDNKSIVGQWKAEILPIGNRLLDILIGPITGSGDRKVGLLEAQYHKLKTGTAEIISNISTIRGTAYTLLALSII